MPGVVVVAFPKQDFMAPTGPTGATWFLAARAKDISQWREATLNVRGHKVTAGTGSR